MYHRNFGGDTYSLCLHRHRIVTLAPATITNGDIRNTRHTTQQYHIMIVREWGDGNFAPVPHHVPMGASGPHLFYPLLDSASSPYTTMFPMLAVSLPNTVIQTCPYSCFSDACPVYPEFQRSGTRLYHGHAWYGPCGPLCVWYVLDNVYSRRPYSTECSIYALIDLSHHLFGLPEILMNGLQSHPIPGAWGGPNAYLPYKKSQYYKWQMVNGGQLQILLWGPGPLFWDPNAD